MHKALKGYLRGFGLNGVIASARRLIFVATLSVLLPVAACAYTVVLRSGRRVEVPANFIVTKLTLTYETAPGINITLLMPSIDIQATERANNEPAGALLQRAAQQAITKTKAATTRPVRRELTKQDIEAARQARQRSEQEYERRRIELGLPSLEETRQRTEEETKRLSETAWQSGVEEAEAEAYWRMRSTQLRTEIAALDAQVNYVRARLAETPEYTGFGNYGFISGVAPGFHPRQPRVRFPVVTGNSGFMRGNNQGIQGAGFLAFGGATQAQIQLNAGLVSRSFGRRGIIRSGIVAPSGIYLGTPYSSYDYSGERANLIYRLLEEEARRAGALPGWLRP